MPADAMCWSHCLRHAGRGVSSQLAGCAWNLSLAAAPGAGTLRSMTTPIGRRTLMQWTASGLAATSVFGVRAQAQPTAADEPRPMHFAMVLYPNFTALDFVGPQQVFSAIEGAQLHVVAQTLAPVPTDAGFSIVPTATFADVPDELELLFVPGGTAG